MANRRIASSKLGQTYNQPVSEQQLSWFHCGHCGSLFKAEYDDQTEHICTECGQPPFVEAVVKSGKPVFSPSASPATSAIRSELPQKRESKAVRSPKRSRTINKLIIGWVLVMALLVFIGRMVWRSSPQKQYVATKVDETPLPKDIELLTKLSEQCRDELSKFLTTQNMGQRAQFTINPEQTSQRMEPFYVLNPLTNIDPKSFTCTGSDFLNLPAGRAIECQWKSSEGHVFDSVFSPETDSLRFDWDHFVKYSEYPWALFLAGDGPDEAEFRLLARQRFGSEGKNTSSLNIVFYAVAFGTSQEIGSASPEFQVPKNTKNGKLLDAAFGLEKNGKRPFGINLKTVDPEGYIRVRVRIRRATVDNVRSYELLNVIACHWYSTVEPGMEISDQPLEK
jgi:hypothetical protein